VEFFSLTNGYWQFLNSKKLVEKNKGEVNPRETFDLVNGSDLNSICSIEEEKTLKR
jgi:hypothetical protein